MKQNKIKNVTMAAFATSLIFSLNIATASANSFGVVGLFQVESQKQYAQALLNFKETLPQRACKVARQGMIADGAGDIDIAQPNRFLILACENSQINKKEGRSTFASLSAASENTVILEGALAAFPEDNSPSAISERAYILKISHYNNDAPDMRDHDLNTLRKDTLKVADRYRRDVFVDVDRAVGMETPDEVALIFYDNPTQGERFRENNPEILEKVGAFNKNHLNDHIYYFGMAEQ